MCNKGFTPIFNEMGEPIICYLCGAEIVGYTVAPETDMGIHHCNNGHMIGGCAWWRSK